MVLAKEKHRLHFVGIGGIGMSGIAEVFLNQGYRISGSDRIESETTERLKSKGAQITYDHSAANVHGASVVVISSAVKSDNPEVIEARRMRIPVIPRAEMLGELMRGKTGISIAGSHGKTTTTSMVSTMLNAVGRDPTCVIGGKVDTIGGNAKWGQSNLIVAEADESDGSFLHLPSTYSVITNIDNDHLDHFGTMEKIDSAFVEFVAKIPFYGAAIVCGDDPGVRRILEKLTKPYLIYGTQPTSDYFCDRIRLDRMESYFDVIRNDWKTGAKENLGSIHLQVPGAHNVLNALAAAVVGLQLGLSFDEIQQGLKQYRGVARRFEVIFQDTNKGITIVDDYGHHPTEVRATIQTARKFWDRRILTVFQPHRYSRTQNCEFQFIDAFQGTDLLFLTDIYPAGEAPIEGVHSRRLAEKIGKPAVYSGSLEETEERLLAEIKSGDLVLCLGAGSITKVPRNLAKKFR